MITTEFFTDKLNYDLAANIKWSSVLENLDYEETNFESIKWMSHIINVHHILNCTLLDKMPESEKWDVFEPRYFIELHKSNHLETLNFLENNSENRDVELSNSSFAKVIVNYFDVYYQILNHAAHHRAQIAFEIIKQHNKTGVSTDYLDYVAKPKAF